MRQNREIHIAAALVTRPDGNSLFVCKRGTAVFMQPGGKLDADEVPVDTLRRELVEELRLDVSAQVPVPLGRFSAPAVN